MQSDNETLKEDSIEQQKDSFSDKNEYSSSENKEIKNLKQPSKRREEENSFHEKEDPTSEKMEEVEHLNDKADSSTEKMEEEDSSTEKKNEQSSSEKMEEKESLNVNEVGEPNLEKEDDISLSLSTKNKDKSKKKKRKEKKDKKDKKNKKEKKDKEKKKDKSKEKKKTDPETQKIVQNLAKSIFGDSDEEEVQNNKEEPEQEEALDLDFEMDEDQIESQNKKKLRRLIQKERKKKKREREKDDEKKSKERSIKRIKRDKQKEITQEEQQNQEGQQEASDQEGEVKQSQESYFDQVMESLKKGRTSRKRKNQDGDTIDDETINEIRAFLQKMDDAADEDYKANQENKPALSKLKMLGEVISHLEKQSLQRYFIHQNLLVTLRKWLSPMPDKSLPNMNVRTTILTLLTKFHETPEIDHLKESEIGKVVMVLYKHSLETKHNKKMAKLLIEKWSRPIFGISAKYKDLQDLEEESSTKKKKVQQQKRPTATSSDSLNTDSVHFQLAKKVRNTVKDAPTFHAHIPEKIDFDFAKRPSAPEITEIKEQKKVKHSRIEEKIKNMKNPISRNVSRAISMSIEGRNFPM